MDIYSQIAVKIIEKQENIVGPVAVEQAKTVSGLIVGWDKHEATVSGDGSSVIDKLVNQYKGLFGQISVDVCKEAASSLVSKLPSGGMPQALK